MTEIKTSKEIWEMMQRETELWKNHQQTMSEYLAEANKKWIWLE